jgi:succinate dehydrogenase/fumarate reductase flavoprotein subunit
MATQILPKRSEVALSIPTTSDLAVGEIAMNVTDGKFYTKTSGNVIKEMGGAGAVTLQAVTTSGAITNNDIVLDGSDIIFEGALANAFETTLTVAEPTADRIVTLPDQSGTLAMDGDALAYAIVFGG